MALTDKELFAVIEDYRDEVHKTGLFANAKLQNALMAQLILQQRGH